MLSDVLLFPNTPTLRHVLLVVIVVLLEVLLLDVLPLTLQGVSIQCSRGPYFRRRTPLLTISHVPFETVSKPLPNYQILIVLMRAVPGLYISMANAVAKTLPSMIVLLLNKVLMAR